MAVDVVLAEPDTARRATLTFVEGMTVAMALEAVSEAPVFAGYDLAEMPAGIFGEVVESGHVLRDNDRVELYRPLRIDPKESRRMRAEGRLPG